MRIPFTLAIMAAAFLATVPAPAEPAKSEVRLFEGLGKHTRTVATANPEAQKYFNQGLNFTFAFNHAEAIRAYRKAAELDPKCAMAHWGVALASGVNYNDPRFSPEQAKAAGDALQRAREYAKAESPANQAMIEALAARYSERPPADPKVREKDYSQAMKAAWERFDKDADIGALYAESMMNLRPWELWTADGKPEAGTLTIIATLDAVLKLDPDHPLALHLYVHALEASPTPEKADEAAKRLRGAQPALGHLLHMPSHLDIRRGRWQEAVEANALAIEADRKYQRVVPEQGFYRMYMAHNYHMLAFAAMMQGESKRAIETIHAMIADVPKEWLAVKENAAIADGFVAMPLEALKRFGRWDEILKAPEPPEVFPIARAMWRYDRGVAFAATGKIAKARESQKAFRDAAKSLPAEAIFGNNKAADLLAIADDMLEGEILLRENKMKDAIASLERAVKKEDALRYAEPPEWTVPVRHALGAALLHDGQAEAAERVYREDLRRWPENGWSLHGLSASLTAQKKLEEAARVKLRFDIVWKRADVKIPSSCYCVTD